MNRKLDLWSLRACPCEHFPVQRNGGFLDTHFAHVHTGVCPRLPDSDACDECEIEFCLCFSLALANELGCNSKTIVDQND